MSTSCSHADINQSLNSSSVNNSVIESDKDAWTFDLDNRVIRIVNFYFLTLVSWILCPAKSFYRMDRIIHWLKFFIDELW